MLYACGDVWIVWRSTRHITLGSKFAYLIVNVAVSYHHTELSALVFIVSSSFATENSMDKIIGLFMIVHCCSITEIKTKIDKTGKL